MFSSKAMNDARLRPITPEYDPWDPIRSLAAYGRHALTSVELTTTHLCNMRCEHCAVGDSLTMKEGDKLPVDLVLRMLDEVEHLETISITGGEPTYSNSDVRTYLLPILKYARERGIRSQLNSNLTLDLERYELIAPYLDVLHISYNYRDEQDFYSIGFSRTGRKVGAKPAGALYDRMLANARSLSEGGLFVSAESMINYRTHRHLPQIHRAIVEMGCKRHEVHPMYPSAFASHLPKLSLEETHAAIEQLLDARDPELWMLFGTLPFYACNSSESDRKLLKRLREEPNLTIRNDPDGRNRLNVDVFSGDVFVTDFADLRAVGNACDAKLDDIFRGWLAHPLFERINCHCPAADCCGPNLLVMDAYYPEVDFRVRKAVL